jgi:hypothetical protein
MTKDAFDELFREPEVEAEAEAPEAPQAEAPEPEQAAAPEPEQTEGKGETEAAPPVAEKSEDRMVPYAALRDEREKRQAEAARAAELDRRLKAIEQAQQQAYPDPVLEPERAFQALQENVQRMLLVDRAERSRYAAEREFGPEVVADVVEFFNDPKHVAKSHEFLRHPDPFRAAKAYVDQQRALAEIGEDPAAYKQRLREELMREMAQQPASAPARPASKPPAPPRSLTSAPAAGGDTQPGDVFERLFPN